MLENKNVAAELHNLTNNENCDWRKLLEFGKQLSLEQRRTLLWTWPTETGLEKLKSALNVLNIERILSVGCGNGLLEWIIMKSIGVSIYGLEIDRRWWNSKYAVKSFIDLSYIDDPREWNTEDTGDFLQHYAHSRNWEFALLFCYFNNREAFLNYLKNYKGSWIIIIGPGLGVCIHTDPNPFEPRFPHDSHWQLQDSFKICENDVVTIYRKINNIV